MAAFLDAIGWRERLEGLARRVRRNLPNRHNPHAFHEELDAIAAELKQMSRGSE